MYRYLENDHIVSGDGFNGRRCNPVCHPQRVATHGTLLDELLNANQAV
jgi:hypothetical protein